VEKSQSTENKCTKIDKEETRAHRNGARSALSRERTILDKGHKSELWENEPSQNETLLYCKWGPLMVAQWLRYCATNRKVTGSIPEGVIGTFR
jgi:hypothetical protein